MYNVLDTIMNTEEANEDGTVSKDIERIPLYVSVYIYNYMYHTADNFLKAMHDFAGYKKKSLPLGMLPVKTPPPPFYFAGCIQTTGQRLSR